MDDVYPLEVIETIFGELENPSTCFRLIYLRPAAELADPIVCELGHFKVWEDVKYEALSWCWGDVSLTEPITLQGFEWLASANLVVALRHLRRKTETRMLWIDALSIMQGPYSKTLDERAKQVQLMKTIYTNADHVVVWLGVPSRNVEKFLTTFFYDGKLLAEELRDKPDDTIPSLLELLNNPWFSRLWIIQEVVLAKNASILCGDLAISLQKLFRELVLYRQRMQEKARSLQTVSWHRELENFISQVASIFIDQQAKRREEIPTSVSDDNVPTAFLNHQSSDSQQNTAADVRAYARLLTQCRYQQASDPRDKMYGLLGLAHDSISSLLSPDYDEDVSVAYTRTAAAIITNSRSLYLLSQARKAATRDHTYVKLAKSLMLGSQARKLAKSRSVSSLPSWVPDWTSSEAVRNPWSHTPARDDREKIFRAGIVRNPMISVSGPGTLLLTGVLVDWVHACAIPCATDYNCLASLRTALKDWVSLADTASLGPLNAATRDHVNQKRLHPDSGIVTMLEGADRTFPSSLMDEDPTLRAGGASCGDPSDAKSDKEVVFWRVLLYDALPIRMAELRKRGLASETRLRIEHSKFNTSERSVPMQPPSTIPRVVAAYWEAIPVQPPTHEHATPARNETRGRSAPHQGSLTQLDWKILALCMGRTIANWSVFQQIFEDEICAHIKTVTRNQTLFVTRDGFLGMGPDSMTRRDQVWVMEGGSHPFILRPTDSEAATYQLVGECYVSGLMYGEIFSEPSLSYRIRHDVPLPGPAIPAGLWARARSGDGCQVDTSQSAVWEGLLLH